MSLESYKSQDGLVSYAYRFYYRGKRYYGSLGVVSKSVAERMASQAKARIREDGEYIVKGIPTFNEFAPQYMEHFRKSGSENSCKTYHSRLVFHILPLLGERLLSDATTTCLDRYLWKRTEEGASPRTINAEFAVISGLLHYAANLGILSDRSFGEIHWPSPKKGPIRVLTESEEVRLMEAATPHLRPLIRFALQTGLFREELLRLTWNDINWSKREVVVSGEASTNRKRREVPLSHEAIAILNEMNENHFGNDRVFGYRSIRSAFYQATLEADLPGVSCITLRHTFAHRCLKAGIKISMLQTWLGHCSLLLTERYLNVEDGNSRKSIAMLRRSPKPQIKHHPEANQMSLALEI